MTPEEQDQYLSEMARNLFVAKKEEEQAKNRRIEIEQKILEAIDTVMEIGESQSRTVKAGDLKLTIKKELGYSVDEEGLFGAGLQSDWLDAIFDEVPSTRKFSPKKYEKLRDANFEAFRQISVYVTTKPKKPSITLGL